MSGPLGRNAWRAFERSRILNRRAVRTFATDTGSGKTKENQPPKKEKEVCQVWDFDEHPGLFRSDACLCGPCRVPANEIKLCCPDRPSAERIPPEALPPDVPLNKRIVVIGAGLSGLSAAAELIRQGATNLTVLEASPRPGGRIRSKWLKDSVVELGSHWRSVYQWDGPMQEVAIKDGHLPVGAGRKDPTHGLWNACDGRPLPLMQSMQAYTKMGQILKDTEGIKDKLNWRDKGRIMDFVGTRIQQEIRKMPLSLSETASRVMVGMANAVCSRYSDKRSMIANDDFGAYAHVPNSLVHIPLGLLGALSPLLNTVTAERIFYEKEVTIIRWGTVLPEQSPRAIVRCTDGCEYEADYVVVTIPLGVLKEKGHRMFVPHLSTEKLAAIRTMKYGHADKIFIEFDIPFHVWRKGNLDFSWREDEMEERSGWSRGLRWIKRVRGSDHLICLTVVGDEAERQEKFHDRDIAGEIRKFLEDVLGEPELPTPRIALRTKWSTDRHFRGAYTVVKDTEDDQHEDQLDLGEPVPFPTDYLPPVIYFAGEATYVGLNSTVHSALIRGGQVADLVVRVMRKYPGLDGRKEDICTRQEKLMAGPPKPVPKCVCVKAAGSQ